MNSHDGIGQLVDVWLPKAERWIESERDKTIEALVLCFQSAAIDADTAWGDLPAFYQQRFNRCEASMNRVQDGRVLHIATAGDLTSWRSLVAACGKVARAFVRLDREAEAFNQLDDFEWWVFLNFTYSQCGALDCGVGGKRRNLDPAFKVSLNGIDVKDPRFFVDDNQPGKEFSESLKRSAIEYGYFATISDLRLSTVSSIRWMQRMESQAKREAHNRQADETTPTSTFEQFLDSIVPNCHETPIDKRTFGDLLLQVRIAESDDRRAEECYLKAERPPSNSDPDRWRDHWTLAAMRITPQASKNRADYFAWPGVDRLRIEFESEGEQLNATNLVKWRAKRCKSTGASTEEIDNTKLLDIANTLNELHAVAKEREALRRKTEEQDLIRERRADALKQIVSALQLPFGTLSQAEASTLDCDDSKPVTPTPELSDTEFSKWAEICFAKQSHSWTELETKFQVSQRSVRRYAAKIKYDLLEHKFTESSAQTSAFLESMKKRNRKSQAKR